MVVRITEIKLKSLQTDVCRLCHLWGELETGEENLKRCKNCSGHLISLKLDVTVLNRPRRPLFKAARTLSS